MVRQLLAVGDDGQRKLGQMNVGFIGAGGLCSVSFDGAVRLGVGTIVPTDRDDLEKHNVSRVIGAGVTDLLATARDPSTAPCQSASKRNRVARPPRPAG